MEASREQAVKFLQKSVGPHISQLLDKNEEAERYFLQETKKVQSVLCVRVLIN